MKVFVLTAFKVKSMTTCKQCCSQALEHLPKGQMILAVARYGLALLRTMTEADNRVCATES